MSSSTKSQILRPAIETYPLLFYVFPLVSIIAWLFIAKDQRLHWDEPAYLYAGAYLDFSTILDGKFQPSGISYFSVSRILHIFVAKIVFYLLGPGAAAVEFIRYLYVADLMLAIGIIFLTLRLLITDTKSLSVSLGLILLSPIVLWLAFKTMPETPALLFAAIVCYSLLRASGAEGAALGWTILAAAAASATALFKNTLLIMPVTMVAALMAAGGVRYSPLRLAAIATSAGMLSIVIFITTCILLKIPLEHYLGGVADWAMMGKPAPIAARAYFFILEGGALYAALFLAPFAADKVTTSFFFVWFGLATLAVFMLAPDTEERYLLPNLAALAGLTTLAVSVVRARTARLRVIAPGLILLLLALTGGSSVFAQRFMSHEVAMDEIDAMIGQLDHRYGRQRYTLLAPWEYSTFLYLRVHDPDLPLISVHTPPERMRNVWSSTQQRQFFGNRFAAGPSDLAWVRGPLVYVGFKEALPAMNLRSVLTYFPSERLRELISRQIGSKLDESQLTASWAWKLVGSRAPDLTVGHYVAYVLDRSDLDICPPESQIAGEIDELGCADSGRPMQVMVGSDPTLH